MKIFRDSLEKFHRTREAALLAVSLYEYNFEDNIV